MSQSIRSRLSFCGFVGALVLALLLGIGCGTSPKDRTNSQTAPPQEITNSIGMKLVLIPAGKFIMGSPKDEKDRIDDENQHAVEITKSFYLGVYTVTVGQFRQFVKDSGYQTEAENNGNGGWGYNAETKDFDLDKKCNWQNVGWDQTDDYPVVNVTWNDAVAFCDWLSKKEGKKYICPRRRSGSTLAEPARRPASTAVRTRETLKGVANIADASLKQKWSDGRGLCHGMTAIHSRHR